MAQAIGGGYAFSDAAGSYATIVKLARVALLAPVVVLVSLMLRGSDSAGQSQPLWRRLALPWFITAFLGTVVLNRLITVPPAISHYALIGSKGLLLLAVTATAMRSRMDLLLDMGWRATIPVVTATLASFLTALGFALLLL